MDRELKANLSPWMRFVSNVIERIEKPEELELKIGKPALEIGGESKDFMEGENG